MGKRYRVRTGARAAPKVKEKELIKKAKKLMKNADLILPRCVGNCRRCPFDRSRKQIEKVQSISDDEKALNVVSARSRFIIRSRPRTRTNMPGSADIHSVQVTGENQVKYAGAETYVNMPITDQLKDYFRQVVNELETELNTGIGRYNP